MGKKFNYSHQLQCRLQTTEYCRLNVEPLVNICSLTRFWKPMHSMWKHSLQKSETNAARFPNGSHDLVRNRSIRLLFIAQAEDTKGQARQTLNYISH